MATEKPKTTRKTSASSVTKAKVSDLPRFSMSEQGIVGLREIQGVTYEEMKRELNFPHSMTTYKQMSYHSTIAAARTLFEVMISKVDWKVVTPENATEEEKRQAKIIFESMHDMEHSWRDFVSEVTSMIIYGFAPHEKVYRRRLKSSGSKYNDGIIAWKKLPIRSQDSVERFIFSDDGRDVIGLEQTTRNITGGSLRYNKIKPKIEIPKSKFMLFRTGKQRGNPFGVSVLRDCYFAWKYLTQIEETEAVGVQRDLAGLPVIYLPPQFMTEDSTDSQKAIYEHYKRMIRNIQQNQQSGIILPQMFDSESKQPMFKMELLTAEGGKQFDTTKIKEYYKNLILTAMFADILIMGQSQVGSYALGSLKQSMTGIAVQAALDEIKSVINNDLVRQTYELNGWDVSRACTIDYDNLDSIDLEAMSKAIQRYASTGMIERDRAVMNCLRKSIGVDPYPEDEEVHEELLTNNSSKASQGMETPFSGTRTSQGDGNDNDDNMDNIG